MYSALQTCYPKSRNDSQSRMRFINFKRFYSIMIICCCGCALLLGPMTFIFSFISYNLLSDKHQADTVVTAAVFLAVASLVVCTGVPITRTVAVRCIIAVVFIVFIAVVASIVRRRSRGIFVRVATVADRCSTAVLLVLRRLDVPAKRFGVGRLAAFAQRSVP